MSGTAYLDLYHKITFLSYNGNRTGPWLFLFPTCSCFKVNLYLGSVFCLWFFPQTKVDAFEMFLSFQHGFSLPGFLSLNNFRVCENFGFTLWLNRRESLKLSHSIWGRAFWAWGPSFHGPMKLCSSSDIYVFCRLHWKCWKWY